MNNPFEVIAERLSNIEKLIGNLNSLSQNVEPDNTKERLLNVQEAAKLLDLKVPTVYSKVSRGELPYMKKGSKLYFSNIQLVDFIKSGSHKTDKELESEAENYLIKR